MTGPRLALIQTSLVWEDARANRDHFDARLAAIDGVDLIVLPEMFSTGFSMRSMALAEPMNGSTTGWMKTRAAETNAAICGSVIISDAGRFYNRFILARPDGTLIKYDKHHLFRMSTENDNYSSGEDRLVFDLAGASCFPQVCYDLRFPIFSRNNLAFDVMLYVANWPAARRTHWQTLLAARAIENQCYVVGLNRIGRDGNGVDYAGDSAVIDFQGSDLVCLEDRDDIAIHTLDLDALRDWRDNFPAWKDADGFELT